MTKEKAIEVACKAISKKGKKQKKVYTERSRLSPAHQERYEKMMPPGFILKPDLEHPVAFKKGSQWCVRFDYILPRGVVRFPSSRFVLVDDLTGKTTIPVLC